MDKKKLFKVSALGVAALGVSALGALTAVGGTLSIKKSTIATELAGAGNFNSTPFTKTFNVGDGNYTLSRPIDGNVRLGLKIEGGKFGTIGSFNATNGTDTYNCTFTKFSDTLIYADRANDNATCNMTKLFNSTILGFYLKGTLPIIIPNNTPPNSIKLKLEVRSSSEVLLDESELVDIITFKDQFKNATVESSLSPNKLSFNYDYKKFKNGETTSEAKVLVDVDNEGFHDNAANATLEIKVGDSWYGDWAKDMTVSGGLDGEKTFKSGTLVNNVTVNGTSDTTLKFTLNLTGNTTVPNGAEIKIASIKTLYFNGNSALKYEKTLASNLSLGKLIYEGLSLYIPNVKITGGDNTYIRLQAAKDGIKAKFFALTSNGWQQVGDEITLNKGMNVYSMKETLSRVTLDDRGTAVKIFLMGAGSDDLTCYAVITGTNGIRRVPCLANQGVEGSPITD